VAWEIHQILKFMHILLGIAWVGGILFVGWGVYPAAKKLEISVRRKFLFALMKHTHLLFSLIGAGVILTGILLGTVLGPINNWNAIWHTTYGNIWFTALMISLITLFWGIFVGYKKTMRVLTNDHLWQLAETGEAEPLNKAMRAVTVLESVEVLGFMILLCCMILL